MSRTSRLPRSMQRAATAGSALLAALALGALLAACAGSSASINEARYDLGLQSSQEAQAAPAAPGAPGARPLLKVLAVSAPPPLDNDGILYRMNFDSQRTARYANSRWTMSPARLLTERLRTSLGAHATVLAGGDAVQAPMLKVELYEFEQVFESPTQSAGVLAARATLMQGGRVLAQRSFATRAPAPTPDAAGGVRALQAASDDFARQLGTWLSTQSFAGTP
ncbi:ABC-type transport auxiliary lipoprotein family protein [Paraburkholderia silvatlantica]|uniref:Cholesterol transport system auxiliary component n=2 Tax=Paraburkholderia silvatlantica TaxID=321895 RepID=A0ABR6FIQ0_9BURK|nr:ABC-type transport auxiliary lipoprotein family protein [Paraburkholderia silvatlantica]MBB2927309.1 cholesterol transport system auxiliary component [Paraburkholderia silvatlantica]PVY37026.1 cholesterol transport system auxiliary component [Paraburkholderia silvatlantica]PXW41696.1 cholesterol transport system auxiliary component [Paraburkholderia silvatlantica]TDQ93057.1 cholesterol transport system auxiliary component [Paraburkholderia silvatlantica]